MEEEIFGPVLTIYVYEPSQWKETLNLVDNTSIYALTGCVFSLDQQALDEAGKDNDGEMLYSETPVLHRVETALLTCIICGCARSEYLHKMDSFMID